MTAFTQRVDGEGWEIRNRERFKIACCDCGLVHNVVVVSTKLRKGTVLGIAAERNKRSTAQRRRTR